jgi:hypothetical protein
MGVKLDRGEYRLWVLENRVLRERERERERGREGERCGVGEDGSSLFVLLAEYYWDGKIEGAGMQHACIR